MLYRYPPEPLILSNDLTLLPLYMIHFDALSWTWPNLGIICPELLILVAVLQHSRYLLK